LSAAADALVSIIADELRQVSSASELDATLSPPSGDASSEPPMALSSGKH
jgi:hypothetical protein